jgi:GH24 family phage-related lysozyme (muramidase)
MHDGVRQIFPEFSKRFEGYVDWMYLDIKGLVTIGIGNLIDREHVATALPFTNKATGAAASRDEIAAEWHDLKNRTELAQRGHKACEAVTQLRLSDDAIADLVRRRLAGNEEVLKGIFPAWENWPADGQLGVLSIAWAVGAALSQKFPKFTAACRSGDWLAAAEHGRISEQGNPGIAPRNVANKLLFRNAAAVISQGLERSRLFYPEPVPSGGNV